MAEKPVGGKQFGPLVGAIDQGTSSTRFLVFSAKNAEVITFHQIQAAQKYPREGWVEMDPMELLSAVEECIKKACENMEHLSVNPSDIVAVGISNQRETTVAWDSITGKPLYNAIVWQDNRTASTVDQLLAGVPQGNKEYLKPICGLPLSTYFSALKMRWLLDNVPAVKTAAANKTLLFGTIDSWIIWNLTGGSQGGLHLTDVTNASRTMLMNIKSLEWDPYLCKFFDVPVEFLPKIRSSSEIYGYIMSGYLKGVPISGCLGDQQAALLGQLCFSQGQAKNTYGTGCFLLYNTGKSIIQSDHGLLTTVAYQFGRNQPPMYALEGSVAVAGAVINWLRDQIGFLGNDSEIERLAASAPNSGDVYFVPAFSGLFAPYWRTDARGVLCGLTQHTSKAQVARAALESICFQTRDILEAMNIDSGMPLQKLQVNGGMTNNSLLMQLQSDLIGIPVVRQVLAEVTSLGAAIAAGSAEGINVWSIEDFKKHQGSASEMFVPAISTDERDVRYNKWKMAVERSLGWAAPKKSPKMTDERYRLLASIPFSLYFISTFGLIVLAAELAKHNR
ncbi:glycerol kinase-like [Ischnura elegans]|uniref:glycerol kinase-like n=1 Tax=Ischnura elegans TaxID=197161 RepID=UPI001ED8BE5D|nr:glycerol kinase-like [Ischnura elegans]XP_046400392.1 glycerol kinase-like [Ischnura elegans]XP_046400393.1 glycerol kinase-like [Ischnura elegans]XP_046400394.1 glycerol kinase-like [Ischnura elegans]XP_046400395.1 glycerol kinase-like [Ischnura elegans]XP_046400396.1 glycerol kinase-like [Ischnura elegans]